MEGKKEKVGFLKKVTDRFKVLESSQKRLLIIVACVVLALVIITIVTSIILANSIGSAGKVAGNLNNQGFAVAKGNKVYLSNSGVRGVEKSKNGLYEVTKDNKTKLIEESEWIKSINYYKGYLYFLSMKASDDTGEYIRQVVKMKPNGENRTVLVDNIETISIGNASLNVSDGWVYYINADKKLEKIKTNGEKRQQVSDEKVVKFQIEGKYIYYTSEDDESLNRMTKDGAGKEKIKSGVDTFQVVGNDLYYISIANKHLMKIDIRKKDGSHKEIEVVGKAISTFNITDKTIYYAVNEFDENGNAIEQALYKVKTNGKDTKKLADLTSSIYTLICVVDDWVYYTDRIQDSPENYSAIYRVKTNGEKKARVNI